jgi:hypothetical protein
MWKPLNRKNGHYKGSIHITWQKCHNTECPSQQWDHFDMDFEGDRFFCGTCLTKYSQPIFVKK